VHSARATRHFALERLDTSLWLIAPTSITVIVVPVTVTGSRLFAPCTQTAVREPGALSDTVATLAIDT